MKETQIKFNKKQYEYLAKGIRIQMNYLGNSDIDKDLKNEVAPILTKLLKAIYRLGETNVQNK